MRREEITIVNQLGLHARAAAQLVRSASRFRSNIKIIRADNNIYADAKSILSVLTLAASVGTKIELEVEGEDEDEAFSEILDIFKTGFGEL